MCEKHPTGVSPIQMCQRRRNSVWTQQHLTSDWRTVINKSLEDDELSSLQPPYEACRYSAVNC